MLLRDSTLYAFNAPPVQHHSVNFRGLNKALSSKLMSTNAEIDELIIRYPNSNGAIGTLPKHWTMKIAPEERGKTFKSLMKDIGNVAKTLRATSHKYKMREGALENGSKNFGIILQKYGIIKNTRTEKLTKQHNPFFKAIKNFFKSEQKKITELRPGELLVLGNGAFGRAFAFKDDDNKKYVLKVFHDIIDEEFKERNSNIGHYKKMEPNRAAYIKKNTKSNEFAKFYFADLKLGFMVTEYIDKRKIFTHKFSPESIGVKYTDKEEKNLKDGSIIDYGGIKVISANLANNKTVQWVYSQLNKIKSPEKRAQKWNEIFNEASANKVPNAQDRLLGLVACLKLLLDSHKKECLKQIHSLKTSNNQLEAELDYFYNLNYRFKREDV